MAAVALFLWGNFFIQCSGTDGGNSFRFAFLTDIHLEPTPIAVRGFESAIDRVNALRPAFVVTGGDLIADALGQKKARVDSLYDLYNHECGRFQMPVFNAIGNHEHFGVFRESGISTDDPEFGKAMFRKRLGNGRTSRSFDYKAWHFILLDGISITKDRNYIGKADSSDRLAEGQPEPERQKPQRRPGHPHSARDRKHAVSQGSARGQRSVARRLQRGLRPELAETLPPQARASRTSSHARSHPMEGRGIHYRRGRVRRLVEGRVRGIRPGFCRAGREGGRGFLAF